MVIFVQNYRHKGDIPLSDGLLFTKKQFDYEKSV